MSAIEIIVDEPNIELVVDQSQPQLVIVSPQQQVIFDVAQRGPIGPQGGVGPAGPQGVPGSAGGLTFLQQIPATPWVFTHNLGHIPIIMIYDDTDDLVDCNAYADDTTVTVVPEAPTSGKVRVI